ncbi:MAG: neutral/alkaline non-lysosomal ceramidase N-terminal domain-containing protein [Bryobacteraceae bacterium]
MSSSVDLPGRNGLTFHQLHAPGYCTPGHLQPVEALGREHTASKEPELVHAGFGKRCISPPVGVPLAGFAARQSVSTGVHDDLFARALVLDHGASVAAVVSLDLLAVPEAFVQRARAKIQARSGVSPESVLIACTHTHAGPVTISTFFNPGEDVDAAYLDSLVQNVAACVGDALDGRFPARIGVGRGHIEGLAVNRRSADGRPVDEEIGIIKVEDENGNVRGVVVHYACHPTVLGPDNLLVTGDFPAVTVGRLERALGEGAFAMFVNGAEGDISVGHSSELSAIGVIAPGRTFARAEELGSRLAGAALEALVGIPASATLELGALSTRIALPLKRYPAPSETRAALLRAGERVASLQSDGDELRKAKSELLYASIANFYAGETAPWNGGLTVELQGIRIGETVLVGVPAEVFAEIGLRLKSEAPHPTRLIGMANGYQGYLPHRAAYAQGGYEVVSAKVDADAEDRLVAGILALEEELFPQL